MALLLDNFQSVNVQELQLKLCWDMKVGVSLANRN